MPDWVRETFVASTDHGGHDDPNGRGVRYVQWVHEPAPNATTNVVDDALLLRESDGDFRTVHDRHTEGLFSRAEWRTMHARAEPAHPRRAGRVRVSPPAGVSPPTRRTLRVGDLTIQRQALRIKVAAASGARDLASLEFTIA